MIKFKLFIISTILFAFIRLSASFAQTHLEPANGGNGVPGSITGSFIIKWASVDSVANYEYIMSSNPLCFSGCPGDTRQDLTGDTAATEYNLQEDVWYYWITRIYFLKGDTSYWTDISSFLAQTPPEAEPDQLIKIAPNPPSDGQNLTLEIDWAVNPDAKKITLEFFTITGQTLNLTTIIEKSGNKRYQSHNLKSLNLNQGIYIAEFIVDDNPGNPNNKIIKKIIITE